MNNSSISFCFVLKFGKLNVAWAIWFPADYCLLLKTPSWSEVWFGFMAYQTL